MLEEVIGARDFFSFNKDARRSTIEKITKVALGITSKQDLLNKIREKEKDNLLITSVLAGAMSFVFSMGFVFDYPITIKNIPFIVATAGWPALMAFGYWRYRISTKEWKNYLESYLC